jgi:hypothetical protein
MKKLQRHDIRSFAGDPHERVRVRRRSIARPPAEVGRSAARVTCVALSALLLSAGLLTGVSAQTCTPVSQDLFAPVDPGAAMIRPRECSTVEQTPPEFNWPYVGPGPYTVTLAFPDGRVEQRSASYNWLNWDAPLPAGTYSWTVNHAGETSLPRQFTVSADAVSFLVPDSAAVVDHLAAKPRPRGMPDASTLSTMASQRGEALGALQRLVDRNLNETLPSAGAQGDGHWYDRYGMRALWSLMAYIYNRTDLYQEDAKRRVLNLASWDPRGATALHYDESLYIAWVVTLGYDWLAPVLTPAEREQVAVMLSTRIGDLHGWIIGANGWPYGSSYSPPPLWHLPRDSHRNITAAMVATMSTLLVGDLPAANTWVENLLPFALNVLSPWSGAEGGYANGTAYGIWEVATTMSAWYILRWATCDSQETCIDLAQKAWVRNFGKFLVYFVPPTYAPDIALHNARTNDPGTPIGLFGDGFAETQLFELRARVAKGYAHFAPSALACWYASRLVGEDYTRIEYLMSPPDTCTRPANLPSGTANSLYLPSIGWMAMHSDLADPDRTSVYFKSSPPPFGAFNHQSADQNAFVINAGGERLAIESGYYDGYNTGHWQYWVKRTRSKNAITFDGGEGQIAFEHHPTPYLPGNLRYGAITQQGSTADYDIVTGDATDAYSGSLAKAVRSLVYLRPDTILMYENLASDIARTWEWNIHALDPITVISSSSRINVARGSQSLCVDALAGPGGYFTQTDSWPAGAEPLTGGPQWHGKFVSAQTSATVEFIALLRVGCQPMAASATKADGVWSVAVGNRTISIGSNGTVSVAP